ncbi:MAG: hypothetical protein OEY01_16510 [Desulfobulbaceae bacterium]|nr:hypothetical protein [Desulfobulbaceae bacterium]
MKKSTICLGVTFCLFLLVACSSSSTIDKIITPTLVKGAVKNFTLSDIKIQNGKSINGGMLVTAYALVPLDIKREQVKPTLLASIKALKDKHPNCEWIIVYLCPDPRLKNTGVYAGMGEYAQEKIEITYGIPSKEQLADQVDPSTEDYSRNDLLADLDFSDWEPIRPPTKEEFNKAIEIDTMIFNVEKKHLVGEDAAYQVVAEKTGRSVKEIRTAKRKLYSYFTVSWGKEAISYQVKN